MAKLVLVRHGESRGNVWSEANRSNRTNFLTQKGRKQAEIAGIELATDFVGFETVISSEMTRSCETMVTIMSQFDGNAHQREYLTNPHLNECRSREVADSHREGVIKVMDKIVMPALDEGNVLCVTHYFTMQVIFDYLEINQPPFRRRNLWCDGKHIPNAIPFVYDQDKPNNWVIYNHYFDRIQYL